MDDFTNRVDVDDQGQYVDGVFHSWVSDDTVSLLARLWTAGTLLTLGV